MFLPPLKNELLYEHFARIATATQKRRTAFHVNFLAALAAKNIPRTCAAIVAILQQNIALAHMAKYCPVIFTSLDTHCTPAFTTTASDSATKTKAPTLTTTYPASVFTPAKSQAICSSPK